MAHNDNKREIVVTVKIMYLHIDNHTILKTTQNLPVNQGVALSVYKNFRNGDYYGKLAAHD